MPQQSSINTPLPDLLERAYALDECKTLQDAAEALGVSASTITTSLYKAMKQRGIRPFSSTAFGLRPWLKQLIEKLEFEVQGMEQVG